MRREIAKTGEEMTTTIRTIHILDQGHALCGQMKHDTSTWPDGHKWASLADWEGNDLPIKSVCKLCYEVAALKLGPTKDYPQGKMGDYDEGGLWIGITTKADKVVVHFGTPVAFLGLSAQDARNLAKVLVSRAAEADRAERGH